VHACFCAVGGNKILLNLFRCPWIKYDVTWTTSAEQ